MQHMAGEYVGGRTGRWSQQRGRQLCGITGEGGSAWAKEQAVLTIVHLARPHAVRPNGTGREAAG